VVERGIPPEALVPPPIIMEQGDMNVYNNDGADARTDVDYPAGPLGLEEPAEVAVDRMFSGSGSV